MTNINKIEWVNEYNGIPLKLHPVTIFPYKNRISLNTIYGCANGCTYCQSIADNFIGYDQRTPKRISSVKETLDALNLIRQKVKGFRISIGDFSEPYNIKNQSDTLGLIVGLNKTEWENPIAITSKKAPPDDMLKEIAQFPLRLTQYVSLGDVKGLVEKISVDERILLAERSHSAGIHTVLLLRPLHPSWCDPEEFKPVVKMFTGLVDEVVVSGVRCPAPVKKRLVTSGINIDTGKNDQSIANISPEFEFEMVSMVAEALPNVNISRSRACPSNRRYNLPCSTETARLFPMPEHIQNIFKKNNKIVLQRDWNGYCRLRIYEDKIPELKTLENLILLFDSYPSIPWRLGGNSINVIQGSKVGDLDINVNEEAFEEAIKRMADCHNGFKIMACCSSTCFKSPDPEKESECFILTREKEVVIALVNDVKIKISSAPAKNIIHIPIGSLSLPIETELEEKNVECNQ